MKWVPTSRARRVVLGSFGFGVSVLWGGSLWAEAPSSPSDAGTTIPVTEGSVTKEPGIAPQAMFSADEVSPARAAAPPTRADALALTVSGAVSLGSHEAGQLFLITEALRKSPHSVPLRVATGASAGSANALIAGSEACLRTDFSAEESLGYRVWVDVGLGELFDPARTTRQAIFHGDSLKRAFGYLKEVWSRGLPKECEFAFGVAVTRKTSADMKLAEGLVIPRSAEHFVVRIEGQDSGPPRFANYIDPNTIYHRPALPFSGSYEEDVAALEPAVLASTAFPVAFPPQPIEYCASLEPAKGGQCSEPTDMDLFVDGGVFDNNPLGIAYRTARAGLTKEGAKVELRDRPDGTKLNDLPILYGFVDPDLRNYPAYRPPTVNSETADDPVMTLVSRLGGQMLADARGHELASLSDENVSLLEQLWLVRANFPPISELLGAFFGFFERDFRDFDFHLGTYDSFVDLRDGSAIRLGTESYIQKLDATLEGKLEQVPTRYRKLACIASQVGDKKYKHLAGACAGPELRNFRILLQVAIDRLWANCRLLSAELVQSTKNIGCKQAQGGLPPPRVDPSFTVRGARFQDPKESEFDYTLRLLGDYRFHFRDLGLAPENAGRARIEVRRKLIAMVEALSGAQGSFVDRTAVMTAGRTLINAIYYEPPQKRVYAGIGSSIFTGYLGRLGNLRALYWNGDVRMMNLRELLSGGDFHFSAQATLGLEFALLPLSGRLWQPSVGVRGGYQFSSADGIGIDPCLESNVASDSRRCSGPVIHAPLNFTLLERVRLSLTPTFYPLPRDFGHNWFELEVGVGAELY
jgi:predicted acylesterase/phospholipase RssA